MAFTRALHNDWRASERQMLCDSRVAPYTRSARKVAKGPVGHMMDNRRALLLLAYVNAF
jgi:hypothetical protein